MRVSVLIPTLNRLGYVKESLASARAQSHADLEILVSDDGSRDGTPEYVRQLAQQDGRVRLLPPNPSPGIFTNMNHLLAHASGDAFCLLGDDDLLEPTFVERLLEPLRADPGAVASFCDHRIIDAAGAAQPEVSAANSAFYGRAALPGGPLADPLAAVLQGTMCLGFSLYRARAVRGERFDLQCGGAADFDFAVRAARRGPLHFVQAVLGAYRVHPGTATRTKRLYMSSGMVHFLRKYTFPEARHEARRKQMLRQYLRNHAFDASAEQRWAALGSVARYVALGGPVLDAKLAASAVLALSPRPLARALHAQLSSARSRQP